MLSFKSHSNVVTVPNPGEAAFAKLVCSAIFRNAIVKTSITIVADPGVVTSTLIGPFVTGFG